MKVCYLIAFCFLASLIPVKGQIMIDSVIDRLPLTNNENVKALQTDLAVTFDEIRGDHAWETYDASNTITSETALWLTFKIENQSEDTIQTYLYSVVRDVTIYQQREQGFEQIKNGYYVPLPQRANKSEYYFTELTFVPFQCTQIYVRLSSNGLAVPLALVSENSYWELSQHIHNDQVKSITFIYFYIFSIFTIFIFVVVLWLRVRNKLYFYYWGYLLFLLIYGFVVLRKTLAPVGNFFQYAPELSNHLNDPVQFVFIAFYIFFILNLLQVSVFDKLLARTLQYLGVACLVYAVFRFLFNAFFFEPQLTHTIFNIVRLIILPINLVLIFWIILKVKHPLLGYFIVGQSFFFIGAVLGSYINYSGMEYIPGHFFGFKEASNIVF